MGVDFRDLCRAFELTGKLVKDWRDLHTGCAMLTPEIHQYGDSRVEDLRLEIRCVEFNWHGLILAQPFGGVKRESTNEAEAVLSWIGRFGSGNSRWTRRGRKRMG